MQRLLNKKHGFAFTLAEVLIPKRMRGIINGVSNSRKSEIKEPLRKTKKLCAFTLAEVLITLAIIGVISALVIPIVVAKYQHKALETQFKRSVNDIQQIILLAKNDSGIDHFASFCSQYNGSYYNAPLCYNYIIKHTKFVNEPKVKSQGSLSYDTNRKSEELLTYNGKNTFNTLSDFSVVYYTNKMQDGSFLTLLINSGCITFAVDLNGYKEPNKLGHDIFMFGINKNNDYVTYFVNIPNNNLTDEEAEEQWKDSTSKYKVYFMNVAGYPCNLESTRMGNGVGCAYFAMRDVCPYDTSRKYFDCLP